MSSRSTAPGTGSGQGSRSGNRATVGARQAFSRSPQAALASMTGYLGGRALRPISYLAFTTASGLLPAGIAVYMQRGPNGVHSEMRYLVRLQGLTSQSEIR